VQFTAIVNDQSIMEQPNKEMNNVKALETAAITLESGGHVLYLKASIMDVDASEAHLYVGKWENWMDRCWYR
jgi:hypothetical protein